MSFTAGPDSDLEAEAQRQKTALVYRNAGIAQSVNVVNATLLAYVNVSLQASARAAFAWWCVVAAIAVGRFLLARRFLATAPDAVGATTWRRRYILGTAVMAAAWGAATAIFMWNAPDGALLFTGLVLVGMVGGAIPLLAPVPMAFRIFMALVAVPMSAVILLQAPSPLHWAVGFMSVVFLAAMIASARYLHQTLDVAIRLGLEQGRLVENLKQAQAAAEAALSEQMKLAESQRLLKAAVEQSNSSIVVTDSDARIIFVNSAFTRTTGYTPDEALGQNPRLLKSGRVPKETYEDLWATIADGRPWHGELCNKTKHGELYWEAANISPIVDAHGRINNYLAVMDDITQRKQVEALLQEKKDFLAAILENEPECVKVLEADGTLLQMNNAGLSMLEVDGVEEINTSGLIKFVMPEHRALFRDLAGRVFAGETGILEFQVQGKKGTRRWLETHAAPLRDSTGKITYLLGVTRDVTLRRVAEQRLALSLRGADLAMSDWHIPSSALVFGEGWTKLLGYQPEELHPHISTLAGLVNPEDMPATRKALIRHLKSESSSLEVEVRMRHRDGHWIWVLARGMAVERTSDGRAFRLSGTAMDITARKLAEVEIARLSQWNELLLNSAGDGIFGVDRAGLCTFANPAALAILGFSKEEVLGKNAHQLFHHHHKDGSPYPQEDCPIYLTLRDGIQREVEDAFFRKNGESFPIQLTVTPMHEDGQLIGMVVLFQDIARRKTMEQELMRLATTDPLTGVANRRRFLEQLDMERVRVKRFGGPAAILILDIDHFKYVNDTHGHAIGDAVLQHLAELSRLRLRRIDLFGRLGGEEFGILLPGSDAAGAWQFADQFRRYVAGTPLHSSKGTIPFTVSIGVAEFLLDDVASDSILDRADVALYRAKEGGRNRVEMG
jgi:diguanylate cyclase (GGDEF)-like protein/PAS domain S-box-containing protein